MTYNSAHDLPSFVALTKQIKGLKLFTLFLKKEDRETLKKLKAQVKHMGDTIDSFYHLLGDKHWIFHENLNLEKVQAILAHNTGPDDAEQQFIALYNDPDFLRLAVIRHYNFEALRKRSKLLEKARDDYVSGRYYSCIFLLLAIMDGFVNEFESEHKGLHARTSEELGAWDSVISHHKGISSVHRVYTKQISVTITEPVEELYRNGIMHGTVVNFDNIVVATKAWNMLFAVIDWATAKTKAETPRPPERTFREVINQIVENDRNKKLLAAWSPSVLRKDDAGFTDDSAFVACTGYLEAWKNKNYGKMSQSIWRYDFDKFGNGLPKYVREYYTPHPLEQFDILVLHHISAGACEIEVTLKVTDKEEYSARLRWTYESKDNTTAMVPKGNGEWKLVSWNWDVFTFS